MQPDTRLDLLCLGHGSYDLIFCVDAHPGPDEKCFANRHLACGGGPAANAAVCAARLGCTSAFAGQLGTDIYGRLHLEELKQEGVNIHWVKTGDAPTPVSAILVKPDGSRTVVNYKEQTRPLGPDDLDFDAARPKVVLMDGHEPHASAALAGLAEKRGIPVVLDAGSVHQGTRLLAPKTTYLLASEKFGKHFTGQSDPMAAVRSLAKIAPFAAVTLGAKGLVYAWEKQVGKMEAFTVDAVDTTGAGDAFHGAFCAGLVRGLDFTDALKFASAAGALCCTKLGARPGLPDLKSVLELMETESLSCIN